MTAIVHMSAVTREWTLFYTNKVKFKLSETIKTYSVRNVWLQAACLLWGEGRRSGLFPLQLISSVFPNDIIDII